MIVIVCDVFTIRKKSKSWLVLTDDIILSAVR